MIEQFLTAMQETAPEGSRVLGCQFRGDPNTDAAYGRWRAHVINSTKQLDEAANVYFCVSAMQQNERGEWRRRRENFAGGLLLMIDDVGDGPAAKFPLATIDPLPPTAMIETSPANWQAVYFFREAVTDAAEFDALIRAFIDRQFLGQDTGQAGINRVFRPPAGINGKEQHHNWNVRGTEWHPERRYTVAEIAAAFDLTLTPERPATRVPLTGDAEAVRAFITLRATLRAAGMLKVTEPDPSGWMAMRCPWTHQHTGAVDNGAALRLPSAENGWHGAFRCHHGHCEQRGLHDLTEWVNEYAAELLAKVNARANAFEYYAGANQQ